MSSKKRSSRNLCATRPSGGSDYSLNVVNASASNTNFGQYSTFLFFKATPAVYPNNINGAFAGQSPATISNIIGTVGAHELVHRITGIGDIPLNSSNPRDLMSVDSLISNDAKNHTDSARNFFVQNQFQLSANELSKLLNECEKKHGK